MFDDYKVLRREGRRKGVRRAFGFLAATPLSIGFIAFAIWSAVAVDPLEGFPGIPPLLGVILHVTEGAITVVVPAILGLWILGAGCRELSGAFGDPLVLHGRIATKEPEIHLPEKLVFIQLIGRSMLGSRITMDISGASELRQDGARDNAQRRGTREVRVAKQVFKRLEVGKNTRVLCTPTSVGVKILDGITAKAPR